MRVYMQDSLKAILESLKITDYPSMRAGDAGLDLYSVEGIWVKELEDVILKTGLHIEIPSGYVGIIKDRSGFSTKNGIETYAGVIDSTYRGEIKVAIRNHRKSPLKIDAGVRFAQLLIVRLSDDTTFQSVATLSDLSSTVRGADGFGSTGQ